jgi:hypothetical protein
MANAFVVHGPFEIEFQKRRGGRTLVFDHFWSKASDAHGLAEERAAMYLPLEIAD